MSQQSNDLKWTTAVAVVLAFASAVMTSADVRHGDAAARFPIALHPVHLQLLAGGCSGEHLQH